jgi:hypothetical protein
MGSCKRVVLSAREIFRDREMDTRTRHNENTAAKWILSDRTIRGCSSQGISKRKDEGEPKGDWRIKRAQLSLSTTTHDNVQSISAGTQKGFILPSQHLPSCSLHANVIPPHP